MVRVGNNSLVATTELPAAREKAGRKFSYVSIDARGHIFDAWDKIPEIEKAFILPGQMESCVALLANLVQKSKSCEGADSGELLLRYVAGFLPKVKEINAEDVPAEP